MASPACPANFEAIQATVDRAISPPSRPSVSVIEASHLLDWRCPRNAQSNNKVKSRRISTADSYLKPLLIQIANALTKPKKHPECKERYHRGQKKAVIVVCKMLLTTTRTR